ncbi:MAG: CBS domain-containing protein [Steroidobacter sp.]
MRCSEIMKTDVECVSPQTSVHDAARKMRDQSVGFLPVCDERMRPIGTLTDRDIAVRAVAGELSMSAPVEAHMTREVVSCSPGDDIEHARDLMEEHRVSRIMCTTRDGGIEGVISLSDIVDLDEEGGARTLSQISRREVRGDSTQRYDGRE